MPLKIPNLDDRDYSDLVEEAISMINRYAPSWTNYNPSDPGITLIELLAYFTEMLLYRLDRVGLNNKINFLRLLLGLDGADRERLKQLSLEDIEKLIQETVLDLKQPKRAVTSEDYEYLARQAILEVCDEDHHGIRVRCVESKNLEAEGVFRDIDLPGHISLVVVAGSDSTPEKYQLLIRQVHEFLEPKRLLATRLHIVQPCYVWLALRVTIQPRLDFLWENVRKSATEKLMQYCSPFAGGGPDGSGWPFGRNLYLSDIYDVLEQVSGVDYIETVLIRRLSLTNESLLDDQAIIGVQIGVSSTVGVDSMIGTKFSNNGRFITDGMGKLAGIMLKPYELLSVEIQESDIRVVGSLPDSKAWQEEKDNHDK
jgi:hypothetical protein